MLAICAVVSPYLAAISTRHATKGVPRGSQAIYESGSTFNCRDGSKTIAIEQVNDDYCDCDADGSDEPGTSACSSLATTEALRFFCPEPGLGGKLIVSSRVSDGVCDCCDGSDEPAEADCVNTCWMIASPDSHNDSLALRNARAWRDGVQLRKESGLIEKGFRHIEAIAPSTTREQCNSDWGKYCPPFTSNLKAFFDKYGGPDRRGRNHTDAVQSIAAFSSLGAKYIEFGDHLPGCDPQGPRKEYLLNPLGSAHWRTSARYGSFTSTNLKWAGWSKDEKGRREMVFRSDQPCTVKKDRDGGGNDAASRLETLRGCQPASVGMIGCSDKERKFICGIMSGDRDLSGEAVGSEDHRRSRVAEELGRLGRLLADKKRVKGRAKAKIRQWAEARVRILKVIQKAQVLTAEYGETKGDASHHQDLPGRAQEASMSMHVRLQCGLVEARFEDVRSCHGGCRRYATLITYLACDKVHLASLFDESEEQISASWIHALAQEAIDHPTATRASKTVAADIAASITDALQILDIHSTKAPKAVEAQLRALSIASISQHHACKSLCLSV